MHATCQVNCSKVHTANVFGAIFYCCCDHLNTFTMLRTKKKKRLSKRCRSRWNVTTLIAFQFLNSFTALFTILLYIPLAENGILRVNSLKMEESTVVARDEKGNFQILKQFSCYGSTHPHNLRRSIRKCTFRDGRVNNKNCEDFILTFRVLNPCP